LAFQAYAVGPPLIENVMRLNRALSFLAPGFVGSISCAALLFPVVSEQPSLDWWWWAMVVVVGVFGLPWNLAVFLVASGLGSLLQYLAERQTTPDGRSPLDGIDFTLWGMWAIYVCLVVGAHINTAFLFRILGRGSDSAQSGA